MNPKHSSIRLKILMKCLLLQESNISEICNGKQARSREWTAVWDLSFLLVHEWNTWHKAITLLCTAISCFLEYFFLMFFPQLEINMDWRQNCLIDLRFSRYRSWNISLRPITADLVAASLCGVTFLFSLPDSWVGEGFFIYLYINFVILEGGSLSIFTHHYRHQKRVLML